MELFGAERDGVQERREADLWRVGEVGDRGVVFPKAREVCESGKGGGGFGVMVVCRVRRVPSERVVGERVA
jgi:hypothetical protein